MILLQIALVATIFSIINCFQFAAALLAKQIGRNFWRWFWISLFLPIHLYDYIVVSLGYQRAIGSYLKSSLINKNQYDEYHR